MRRFSVSGVNRNISMSEWCIDNNNSDEDVSELNNFETGKIIESVIVPIVGSLGIAGIRFYVIKSDLWMDNIEQKEADLQYINDRHLKQLFIGNIVSIMILSKKEFRETFHRLLISLAVVDIIFIICAIFTCIIRTHSLLQGHQWQIFEPIFLFIIPMGSCALVTSMYLTVSIRS